MRFGSGRYSSRLLFLRPIKVHTKTLFKKRRDHHSGYNCASILTSTILRKSRRVRHLMIALVSVVVDRSSKSDEMAVYDCDGGSKCLTTREKLVIYFHVRKETEPFPDPSIIETLDTDRKHATHSELADMPQKMDQNDVSEQYLGELCQPVMDNINLIPRCFFFVWLARQNSAAGSITLEWFKTSASTFLKLFSETIKVSIKVFLRGLSMLAWPPKIWRRREFVHRC